MACLTDEKGAGTSMCLRQHSLCPCTSPSQSSLLLIRTASNSEDRPGRTRGASQQPSPVLAWRLCLWTRSGTALGLPDPGWASPGFCPPACWLAAACPRPEELGSRGVAFLRRCQCGGQGDARTALPENAADCTKRARGC